MPTRTRVGGTALLALLAVVGVSCTSRQPDAAPSPSAAAPSAEPSAQPWPDRPVVSLAFDVAADLTSATGQEHLDFTPDLKTCELVFRLWPNKPATSLAGSSLVVDSATVDGAPATTNDVA